MDTDGSMRAQRNFLETYVQHRARPEEIADRLQYLESSSGCDKENIQQHIDNYRRNQCDYDLGERFLLAMYAAVGPDVVSAALKDLHTQSLLGTAYLDESSIYYAFLANAPPGKEETVKTVYRRYHGGPVVNVIPADSPERPSLVALYEAANGMGWASNENWLSNAPVGAWHGVTTEPGGIVGS